MEEAIVRRIALLARIEIDEGDVERATHELTSILRYFDKLGELDTEGVEPLGSPIERSNMLAPDEVSSSLGVEATLANAPRQDGAYFRVPRIPGGTP